MIYIEVLLFLATTHNAILAEFEEHIGGTKWEVLTIEFGTLERLELEAWAKQDSRDVPPLLRRICAEGGTLREEQRQNGLVEVKGGVY